MPSHPVSISAYRRKKTEDARALRVARIARQVRQGTYYVSGREIAVKFLRREQAGAC